MIFHLFAIVAGIAAGTFTGLIPGIHINLVSTTLVSLSPFLLDYLDPLSLAIFIVSMSVTHTFLDTIPSVFLGAPDSATALGVLPGHRYLLKGLGKFAVKLTLIGSISGLILSSILFPIFMFIIKEVYALIKGIIGYILIVIIIFMILRTNKRHWSLFVFLASGCLGLIVLNMDALSSPLFPLLSGIFGTSTLIYSLNSRETIPKQDPDTDQAIPLKVATKAILSGQFSGFLTAMLPGLGASSAAVISLQITRKLGDVGFMILIGSISTVNFVLSLATFYIVDKARNGSVIAISELIESIQVNHIITFIGSALIAGSIALILGLKISKIFAQIMQKVSYRSIIISVIVLITSLVFIMTGYLGLIVLTVSTSLGLIPAIIKVPRTNAMGCLILPVILYFIL